jgi:Flp pilus assembly protein TadD
MKKMPLQSVVLAICMAGLATVSFCPAFAGDLKITIPKRTKLTPVQRLNREGVEAVTRHNYKKAQSLFYKAYLYDPDDPFTLYNLGYISELEGELDRAKSYYSMAAQQASDAVIAKANLKQLQGKHMKEAVVSLQDASMEINRDNVEAVRLLGDGRAAEADMVLQQALAVNPKNAFTLNNLGVAKETEGDLEQALKYYNQAAASQSKDPAVVTLNSSWRGKPVAEMAEANVKKVRARIEEEQDAHIHAALLNLRGVAAVNRNDSNDAAKDFLQAYKLDPNNAFSLNNAGYVSEMDGDLETADFFYEKARSAEGAGDKVGLATRRGADGKKLTEVAEQSDQDVESKIEVLNAARRRENAPIELKRRDGQAISAPSDSSQQTVPPTSPDLVPRPPQSESPQPQPQVEPQ